MFEYIYAGNGKFHVGNKRKQSEVRPEEASAHRGCHVSKRESHFLLS